MKKILSLIMTMFIMLGTTGCEQEKKAELPSATEVTKTVTQAPTEAPQTPTPTEKPKAEYTDMRLHFIDVGQGDSTFLELGNGQTMLIDAGNPENGSQIVSYIKDFGYSDINYVVATHPHSDHIGGLSTVLQSFSVGDMYMPGQTHTSQTFENLVDTIANENITLHRAKAGVNILNEDKIKIDILAPFNDEYSNLNNCSAVVRVKYGNTVALFTGDAEQQIEAQILNSGIDADILKVGHHGSDTASTSSFVSVVTPKTAVISCGKYNSYGHPHDETLAILDNAGADIYRTDEVGTVIVTADSEKNISVDKKASEIKENAPPVVVATPEPEQETNAVASNDNTSQVVYITRTGSKFHRDGCSYLNCMIRAVFSINERKYYVKILEGIFKYFTKKSFVFT